MNAKSISPIDRQNAYVASLSAKGFKFSLAVGTAFVRGIREIGYKHTGSALDELIDNGIESGAANIHIVLNDDGTGRKNTVTQIAVIDDGCGMVPGMLHASVLWGGTDRENSRLGIGRFGYGLPSSCVSQGKRFTVYSNPAGGKMHSAGLDLTEIEEGKYNTAEGDIVVPVPRPATLPRFVQEYAKNHLPDGKFKSGTVVVIDKLDKVTWKSTNSLANNLMEHFGVTYHKLRSNFELFVNGKKVEAIDPLFLTPGYRWYDLDADRAEALDPMQIEVKDKETREEIGRITVRFSYTPLTFGAIDKTKPAVKKNANERFTILKEYNGFIICRMGRVMEVVRHSPLRTFVNYDRYFKVEIDFDASLDELFNVPTTKQRVDVSDRIWEILKEHGVEKALEQLAAKVKGDKAKAQAQEDTKSKGGKRASEVAMAETSKMSNVVPLAIEEKRAAEGKKRLLQEAERRSSEKGVSKEEAQREIEAELGGKAYKVALRQVPGGAFFEVEQIGGTKVLWLNTSSRFFQEMHSGPNSSPSVRAALEILLFAIGDRILDGRDELKSFYAHEVPQWSLKLEYALAKLSETSLSTADEDEEDDSAVA